MKIAILGATGRTGLHLVRWGLQITRADLAQSLFDALLNDSTIHQTISVAN
jgi:putative NADH-flavin reductase